MTSRSSELIISGQAARYTPTCPRCGEIIHAQAVTSIERDAAWSAFWSFPGQRWVRCLGWCDGLFFTHFYALGDRHVTHRLAWEDVI